MRKKILVVDDMKINLEMLAEILQDEYTVITAENGKQAVEMMEAHEKEIMVLLLDLILPVMDGFEVLKIMKERAWIEKIPVLIISSESSTQVEKRCFDYGVSDYIRKPFDNALVKMRVKNIVDLHLLRNKLEEKVEKQTQLLWQQAELLQKSNENIIDILGSVIEGRNMESGEHIKRIKGFTKILALQLMEDYPEYAMTMEKADMIAKASALHDIGKIAIPDGILLKPAKLTVDEYEYMKSHTTRGCEILNQIKGVWSEEYHSLSYEICRYHHERYDGKGYPDGLAEEAIPISAQLVSIADAYDALVNERVYKSAYSKEQAFHMIMTGECGTFSPRLLNCFQHAREQFEALVDKYIDAKMV
ncbi:MAG: response regulator [Lachnospiraceae bacterium]|nr:response regulator [Lachnospiraceae bacterium]